jgi:hypothetical protein
MIAAHFITRLRGCGLEHGGFKSRKRCKIFMFDITIFRRISKSTPRGTRKYWKANLDHPGSTEAAMDA